MWEVYTYGCSVGSKTQPKTGKQTTQLVKTVGFNYDAKCNAPNIISKAQFRLVNQIARLQPWFLFRNSTGLNAD